MLAENFEMGMKMAKFKKYLDGPKKPPRMLTADQIDPRLMTRLAKGFIESALVSSPAFDDSVRIRVQKAIAVGDWRAHPAAKDWAGNAVAAAISEHIDVQTGKPIAKALLKEMLAKGQLRIEQRPDANGKMCDFVVVGEAMGSGCANQVS
ncbi:hypothetical protein [Novosphingobium beihaiensis]|uniref:Uncharacterized protein n=1 Tax=Novosphingobium beihaiensis TaxID=2930389 RepID=A0ABT0BK42_9SPHN|nr:hypothetical protein [Novosphingobium beihaiensis]MCJ2185223.1 hypothetical protein [Novosphingobium beihaiensis]